ncbi:hypothetical protein [Synechococcus sp. ROS8604]|uniref:hypothetical protein n=1 Tax=Synechococcus sp. ROS8604 TaxID=1442557 RepID=UPI00185F6086|nr:hypothetical protein [Synechococcus sp. ROS8604]QNI88632.1 biogenesis domain protein [Synechococcus sp. ROS8604]
MSMFSSMFWLSRRTALLFLALAGAVVAVFAGRIELAVLTISQSYADWLTRWTGNHDWAVLGLPVLAFGGGLIASVSPCALVFSQFNFPILVLKSSNVLTLAR